MEDSLYISEDAFESKVSEETALHILSLQKRCVACGSTLYLQIHHRVHKSEGEKEVQNFLQKMKPIYEKCYKRILSLWHLHSIQNLVVLCRECHEGQDGRGVHGGNQRLRTLLRYSFTCPITGFNISFYKPKTFFNS